jgi:hypothetical protein
MNGTQICNPKKSLLFQSTCTDIHFIALCSEIVDPLNHKRPHKNSNPVHRCKTKLNMLCLTTPVLNFKSFDWKAN